MRVAVALRLPPRLLEARYDDVATLMAAASSHAQGGSVNLRADHEPRFGGPPMQMPRMTHAFVVCACFASWTLAVAAESKKVEPSPREDRQRSKESRPSSPPEANRYCADIATSAEFARNARQEKRLLEIEQRIVERTAQLEAKRLELQELLDRHDALTKNLDEQLVSIYGRMRPDAAAAQFAAMEDDVAATMLMRLKPKQSSAILNEMEAARAVALTKKVAALSTLTEARRRP